MKKSILLFVGCCLLVNQHFAQAPSAAFAPIKEHLERWDDIRGAWLALAIQALASKQAIPDRTFPEDFTPYEMLSMMPAKERQDLRQMVLENQRVASTGNSQTTDFGVFAALLEHSFCSRTYGRSYGDPHLKSYDRATYSFQTVGEFVLSKNNNGLFEVQDASSQMVAHMLDIQPGMRVVDTCAGAGGKTLHMACLMQNKGQIIAMDLYESKLKQLKISLKQLLD